MNKEKQIQEYVADEKKKKGCPAACRLAERIKAVLEYDQKRPGSEE